jgi:hypothetical protein
LLAKKNERSRRYLELQIKASHLSSIPTPECEILNMEMDYFGHNYLYDPDSLFAVLSTTGFKNVRIAEVDLSNDPALSGIDSHARIIGNSIATKPWWLKRRSNVAPLSMAWEYNYPARLR